MTTTFGHDTRALTGNWYRGGTSKCWLFTDDELGGSRDDIADTLIEAFGSGDPRQLDGVGGGTSTTSKAAVVSASAEPGIDVDYLFAQVGIDSAHVEFTSNCGNCASAIALFAVQRGFVDPSGETTVVRMRNENTRVVVHAVVDTPGARIPSDGLQTIPGSSHPGVGVDVNFEGVDGASTGALLPTGNAVDDFGPFRATCLDAGAPACLIAAPGLLTATAFEDALPSLIETRTAASYAMGLTSLGQRPSPAVPKVGVVGPPVDYTAADGARIAAGDYDVAVRMVSMFAPHPAIGITSAVAVARAALVPGSTVAALVPHLQARAESLLRLGTPAGVIEARISAVPGAPLRVGVRRSARHIASARIDLPASAD